MNAVRTIASILEYGQKSNSYKCALARALSEIPETVTDANPTLKGTWVAERFVTYYWPLATQLRLRQSTDPAKEPVVVIASKELFKRLEIEPGTSISEVRKTHSQAYEEMIRRLAAPRGCLDEVLPRFHTVKGKSTGSAIYDLVGLDVALRPGVATVLKENRQIVRQLALGAWVRFNETVSASPKLYLKLSGERPKRKSLKPQLRILGDTFGLECFYCGKVKPEMHVDHFLPWSFVFEDKLWNLVLACGGRDGCNGKKLDHVPRRHVMDRLIKRNVAILSGQFGSGMEGHKDFKEWRIYDLPKHIEQLAAAALAEGFPEWV